MKDAAKIDVLVKRWRNLWTHVDSIIFFRSAFPKGATERFLSDVDKALMQCSCPNIKKFVLHFHQDPRSRANEMFLNGMFFNWFSVLLRKMWNIWSYGYSAFAVSRLSANRLVFYEEFVLERSGINNEQIAQLISGCPQLETIVLDCVYSITNMNIMSNSVKTLRLVRVHCEDDEDPLHINALWLQELNITKDFGCFNCRFLDMSSLGKDDRSFTVLGHDNDDDRIMFNNWTWMTGLLQNSHILETLLIKVVVGRNRKISYYFNGNFKNYTIVDKLLYWQRGNFQHPRNVKFVYNKSFCSPNELEINDEWGSGDHELGDDKYFDFELITYVLRNACNLEKLIITSQQDYRCECGTNYASKHASLLLSYLSSIL
ncbi:hypothetical protein Salat_1526900 [Sesamum alatum]|uniref:FBD domain-containing protein n=1 Tax=Sesamum alatum TaxID=300844 RepID=A0AAE2CMG7_9LAMI|nr:hypothetical protein Salat_1526900 [Sesamum alatum]